MPHELDNTMETLLRRAAARREEAQVLAGEAFEHLEPEDFAAFAENVLSPATRVRFAGHLADCADCRQTLANFALIQEAEEATAPETALAPEKSTAAKAGGWNVWFKNLFTLPSLGYAAAALAILFVGMFGFVALRSSQQKETVQVAFVEPQQIEEEERERRRRAAPPAVMQPPTPEPTIEQTPEPTPDPNANLADISNQAEQNEAPRSLPPSYRVLREQSNGGTTANERREEVARDSAREANQANRSAANNAATVAAAPLPQPTPTGAAPNKPTPSSVTDEAKNQITGSTVVENETDAAQKQAADALEQTAARTNRRAAVVAPKSFPSRTVGGKTFRRNPGVWTDLAYNGQTITEIRRGTDDYKKLDAGLRSIAEQLSGEVLIVWQGKAYRIR